MLSNIITRDFGSSISSTLRWILDAAESASKQITINSNTSGCKNVPRSCNLLIFLVKIA